MKPSNALRELVEHVFVDEVGPALGLNAAGTEVVQVLDGVVRVRLGAECAGCPITSMTTIHGIEQELRRRAHEIEYVQVVQ